jgi:hypothetical protein
MAKGNKHAGQRQKPIARSASKVNIEVTTPTNDGDQQQQQQEDTTNSWQDTLIENIEFLTEKRSGNRVYALNHIDKIMRKHVCTQALSNYSHTLLSNTVNSLLKSSSDEETILSMRVLSLLAITVGPDQSSDSASSLISRVEQQASEIMRDKIQDSQVRRAAVLLFTIWKLVMSGEDDHLLLEARNVLQTLWPRVPEENYKADQSVLSESISCWSLLNTVLSTHQYQQQHARVLFKLILNNHSNYEVKRCASEALCLLKELNLLDEDELSDDLLDTIDNLSSFTDRSIQKKDKAVQKSYFREYSNWLQNGEAPNIPVTVNEVTFNLNSWLQVIQFNLMRAMLHGGINEHIAHNDFVRHVLGLEDIEFQRSSEKMTALEKKAFMSKSSSFSKEDTKQKNKLTRAWSGMFEESGAMDEI